FNLISRAQRFHDWTYDTTVPPRLAKSWLTAKPLTLTPIEKVVIDKFLRALPYEAKRLACQTNPQSADQLVELVEGQQVALEVLRSGQTRKKERKKTEDHARSLWESSRICLCRSSLGGIALCSANYGPVCLGSRK
uniref:SCAN box domain-containing protein n=1 Tax=Esox lucius TaxID=8010 RepID=A0A6Q2YMH5_ESOLU